MKIVDLVALTLIFEVKDNNRTTAKKSIKIFLVIEVCIKVLDNIVVTIAERENYIFVQDLKINEVDLHL